MRLKEYHRKKSRRRSKRVRIKRTNPDSRLHNGMVYSLFSEGDAPGFPGASFVNEESLEGGFMKSNFTSEVDFIKAIAPAAQKACKRYGYLPSVLIAQSCHENGYGIRAYWDNPGIEQLLANNNMVGQKAELLTSSWADKSVWPGKSFEKKTPEEYSGRIMTIKDSFRIFDNIEQSFCDYLLFLKYASNYGRDGVPKYGDEVLAIKDPKRLIRTVAGRGYATGSTYPSAVMEIINKHDLTKYDDLTMIAPSMIVPDSLKLKYGLTDSKTKTPYSGASISDSTAKKEAATVTIKTAKGKKVMIDAGHYGYYNQSPAVKEYWESKMTWKLHLMLKEELEKYGIVVGTTRKNQESDMALYDRGYSSKGYDLFISVHSNAVGDYVNEKVDYPVCFVQVSGKSDKIGTLLSECVREVMQTAQPADHWSQKGNNGDYYGVLRGATAAGTVGCIIEHSFHTQTRATKWLLQDANLRKLAIAEAKVINDYLAGVDSKTGTAGSADGTTAMLLKKGSTGDAVKTMQEMLITCGYSCGSAGADGDFGQATELALMAMQIDFMGEDEADGIYGPKSREALEKRFKEIKEKAGKPKTDTTVYEGIDYAPVYNYSYYRQKYADLQKAYGTDKAAYFDHFCKYGMKEGRRGASAFDVQKYKGKYSDLRKAFGDDLPKYYRHYCEFGKKEGRKAT